MPRNRTQFSRTLWRPNTVGVYGRRFPDGPKTGRAVSVFRSKPPGLPTTRYRTPWYCPRTIAIDHPFYTILYDCIKLCMDVRNSPHNAFENDVVYGLRIAFVCGRRLFNQFRSMRALKRITYRLRIEATKNLVSNDFIKVKVGPRFFVWILYHYDNH